MSQNDKSSELDEETKLLEEWVNQSLSVKKQILNHLLAQDQQAQELYAAAHEIHVVIKNDRMVTQQKLLAGLTQWAKSASIVQLSDQQKAELIYSYLLTAVVCEMLKEIIRLDPQIEEPERGIVLEECKKNNKSNTLAYDLKLLLQKQFSHSKENEKLYTDITQKLQGMDELDAVELKDFLEQQTLKL